MYITDTCKVSPAKYYKLKYMYTALIDIYLPKLVTVYLSRDDQSTELVRKIILIVPEVIEYIRNSTKIGLLYETAMRLTTELCKNEMKVSKFNLSMSSCKLRLDYLPSKTAVPYCLKGGKKYYRVSQEKYSIFCELDLTKYYVYDTNSNFILDASLTVDVCEDRLIFSSEESNRSNNNIVLGTFDCVAKVYGVQKLVILSNITEVKGHSDYLTLLAEAILDASLNINNIPTLVGDTIQPLPSKTIKDYTVPQNIHKGSLRTVYNEVRSYSTYLAKKLIIDYVEQHY